jgi:septin family protein
MVVGARNVGKTSFIKFFEKSLTQSEGQDKNLEENRSGSSSNYSRFMRSKYYFKETKKFREHKIKLKCTSNSNLDKFPQNEINLIDSPGYTLMNHKEWIEMILKYINDSVKYFKFN